MRRWPVFLGSILLVYTCLTAQTASAEEPLFKESGKLLLFDTKPLTAQQRQIVASEFGAGCKRMNVRIPALSPREKAWLQTEWDEGRGRSVLSSPETARRQAKSILGTCALYANILAHATGSQNSLEEAKLWLNFLSSIVDANLEGWVRALARHNVGDYNDDDISRVWIFHRFSEPTITKIILPLLGKVERKEPT